MLEIKNVSVQFSDESDVQAVEDVSLTVAEGQKIALVGETGSGKSVLLLAILRLLPETAIVKGQVLYKEKTAEQDSWSRDFLCAAGRRRKHESSFEGWISGRRATDGAQRIHKKAGGPKKC